MIRKTFGITYIVCGIALLQNVSRTLGSVCLAFSVTASCCYRSERILAGPSFSGKIVSFCRQKGHGFIQPTDGSEPLFMHISELVV